MTLNGVMAVTLRYFNEFDKRAFQLITAYSINEHCEVLKKVHVRCIIS